MDQAVGFGRYRFDAQSGRLWAGAREIRITPKASDVLKLLVSRAGEPVSKEDIFASVWTGIAVSDDALTTCIRELRKALDDDAKEPKYIETRHRRGYGLWRRSQLHRVLLPQESQYRRPAVQLPI